MNPEMKEQTALYRPSTHALAIISLVLSILGLMPVLPVVGSIGGIVTGIIARKEIRTRPDLHTGEGYARAGVILGWIGLALVVLVICGFLLFLFPMGWNSYPTGSSHC
jgi:uncharacterized membrane protein